MKMFFTRLLITVGVLLLATLSTPIGSMMSLRQIGDYPLLEMDFYGGGYLLPRDADALHRVIRWFYPEAMNRETDIACSLVASAGNGSAIYGRNFDWYRTVPIMLRTHRTADRYASLSMVDGSYLGVRGAEGVIQRINAMGGYMAPFDGMNEKGLFVGIALVKKTEVPKDPEKETLTAVQMVRRMLDTCATVKEALAIPQTFNVDFFPGPHLHILIGDISGDAAVVEFRESGVEIVRRNHYLCATNFVMKDEASESWEGRCRRFDRLVEQQQLVSDGPMSREQMKSLLMDVKQTLKKGRTEWSAIYESAGVLTLYLGMDYDRPYRFTMNESE